MERLREGEREGEREREREREGERVKEMFIFPNDILQSYNIYTTKIDTFVCPLNISETVAVIIMKLAHRSRIANIVHNYITTAILPNIGMVVKGVDRRIILSWCTPIID